MRSFAPGLSGLATVATGEGMAGSIPQPRIVIAGLDPAIHPAARTRSGGMETRIKSGYGTGAA